MASRNDMLKTRDEYINGIRKELLGPGSEISIPDEEHELITNAPDVRYSIGILFPRNNKMNADNDEAVKTEVSDDIEEDEETEELQDLGDDEPKGNVESLSPSEEENLDEEIGLAAQNMPSSMGITFFAKGDVSTVKCQLSFATYIHAKAGDCRIPFYPCNPENYVVPDQFSHVIYFDKNEGTLRLVTGGLNRKKVHELIERANLDVDEFGISSAMYKLADQLRNGYVRVPHSVEVELDFAGNDYIDANKELDETNAKLTALRRNISDNLYSVTVMLVNDDESKSRSEKCIFQPKIVISTEDNNFVLQEYTGVSEFQMLDAEEQSLELQYRNKKVYGTGLGTSVNWEIDDFGHGMIFNDFFPEVEVPSMDFSLPENSGVEDIALSMKFLSDLDKTTKEEKIQHLRSLVEAYSQWIDNLISENDELDTKFNGRYHEIAKENISGCMCARDRMLSGISSLQKDQKKWDAFQLANRAMYMQRVHLKLQEMTSDQAIYRDRNNDKLCDLLDQIEKDYAKADGIIPDRYSWRPFQLAFLLMSIDSVTMDACKDRDLVDLIWFPTGGGKTEAYLGLTALTIFYRRLAHLDQSSGTAVIMRYTLRLLAAQQFTRASTLICACEYIREDATSRRPRYGKYPLGKESITIGLWIGSEHTPNKNELAKGHLKKLMDATTSNIQEVKEKHNKFQVLKCPWCGTKLVKDRVGNEMAGLFGYRMRSNRHFEMFCPQESCFFAEKLPIQIVDEELYSTPPTLLFGTVDKFALLPWKKEIGSFFAAGSENRSPELIIQDELHLISGPLGTMVGLYEAAIDVLCQQKGIKTKIVASTATIRRAKEQCAALYDREVSQFPHPGLNAEDSFFARESNIDYDKGSFGRKYIGLMPSGKTKAMMEVRSIAALLQKMNTMDLPDEIKDKFWTLTVYFNSLKDLGKCSTLVDDDVKDFIKRTAYRLGTAKDARMIGQADELTSRVSTTELNETLDKLEKLSYSKENIEKRHFPSNVLLATNMISVGIDVARLNVMLLVGQPKLTSEYIQASSRVGRSYPGVAFAMYDGSKSRDRSHYEQFRAYHESFYKHVEPTGATPFSKPARDRALHAILIAVMRMSVEELKSEKDAAKFTMDEYQKQIEFIKNFIVKRNNDIIQRINPDMDNDAERIANEIDTVFSEWQTRAESYDEEHFFYGEKFMSKSPDEGEGRLIKVFNTSPQDRAFDTMTSMRNVDSTVAGNVLIWEENTDES